MVLYTGYNSHLYSPKCNADYRLYCWCSQSVGSGPMYHGLPLRVGTGVGSTPPNPVRRRNTMINSLNTIYLHCPETDGVQSTKDARQARGGHNITHQPSMFQRYPKRNFVAALIYDNMPPRGLQLNCG